MNPAAPILILDSGVGGLTIHDALRAVLPEAPVLYAADFAGLPYGDKSEAEIAARVCGLLGRMSERFQPRLACIACNTASTIALSMVRDVLAIPVVGTVPAIKPAAAASRSGVVGLLGTAATIRQPYVDRLHAEHGRGTLLLRHAAPELVLAAEASLRGEAVPQDTVAAAVARLRAQPGGAHMDTVVLACTHFPLLSGALQAALGPEVRFVDGAAGIARRIADLTRGQPFAAAPPRFVATGDAATLARYAPALSARGFAPPALF
ncbi:glutamate racemase [Erythrobacteraceae bacterium CFH 75059]|uniref:glutamate racemase n=1 Tax=Qipengyuania thermophila TaxID=2509361 RepID=UPI001021AD5D|nr:glutamate racemase [Qipengyuania thermophila]TCD02227.1 glutamate racemase [Erythrobacteraceae bacterium CFH 75059]